MVNIALTTEFDLLAGGVRGDGADRIVKGAAGVGSVWRRPLPWRPVSTWPVVALVGSYELLMVVGQPRTQRVRAHLDTLASG